MQTNDYLRQLDLNPNINGTPAPITNPLDPRALCMFGFDATAQEIQNLSGYTVYVSFDYAYDQGIPAMPMPPSPRVHAVLPGGSVPRPETHRRGHCIVWLDPAAVPPQGIPVMVRVSAWA
ncbi:MAG TPA: hypothetical protein VFO62_10290 [Candidatus Binatia bacterium]|nr:hypothetical protein [Candidatus Binatia bacterium]